MKKWLIIFGVIFYTATCTVASGNELNPIDAQLEKCITENYSGSGIIQCSIDAEKAWLNEIDKYITLIHQELNPEQKKIFDKSQKYWLKYYKSEQKVIEQTFFTKSGIINTHFGYGYRYDIVKDRAELLKSYLFSLTH